MNRIFNSKTETATKLEYLNEYTDVFFSRSQYYNDLLVHTCIDVIAKHVGKLTARVIKNGAPVTDTPLYRVLTLEPNPYMTAYDLQYKTAAGVMKNQNAYIKIVRDGAGAVRELWPLDFQTVEAMEKDNDVFLKFVFKKGKTAIIPYADIIHIRSKFQDGEFIAHTDDNLNDNLALINTLQQSFKNAAINSGRIRGVVQITGQAGNAKWEEKAKAINESIHNSETGGIVATDSSVTFTPCNTNPVAADHSQLDYIRENIYRYYGTSDAIISNTYSEPQWQAFYESTIEPIAIRLSQEMSRKLLSPTEKKSGYAIVFDANRLAYADTKTKVELIRQLRPLGILTVNQSLEIMNLPPVADGDTRIQTLNAVNTDIVDDYQMKGGENG